MALARWASLITGVGPTQHYPKKCIKLTGTSDGTYIGTDRRNELITRTERDGCQGTWPGTGIGGRPAEQPCRIRGSLVSWARRAPLREIPTGRIWPSPDGLVDGGGGGGGTWKSLGIDSD
jgi:hypothetical protein